ncbi:MAG: putative bifunctional diguanylate cyclase/phosphodiesterase [Spirochaetales bacterium]
MDLEHYTPEQLRQFLKDYAKALSDARRELSDIRGERERLRHQCSQLQLRAEAAETRRDDLEKLINMDSQTGLPIRRRFVSDCSKVLSDPPGGDGLTIVGVLRLDTQYRRIRANRDRSNALAFRTTLRIQSVIGDRLYQSDRYDEFLFLLTEIPGIDSIYTLAHRIRDVVAEGHDPPAEDISFGCVMGIAIAGRHGETQSDLTDAATIAADRAEEGPDPVVLYAAALGDDIRYRREVEQELGKSLNDGFRGLSLEYQPITKPDGTIVSAEVLTRFLSPALGPISPGLFIPIAEENGDIRVLGQWTLFQACRQLKQWHDRGFESFQLSINLSSLQFKQTDLVDRLEGVLKATRVPPSAVKIELTETAIMDDPEPAIEIMNRMRRQGVSVLIDDFGTGYSSLSYLRYFPADTLKIDKSFVDGVVESDNDQQIIHAIVSLARSLEMQVLAEGVETAAQLEFLTNAGIDLIQGYYFSEPVPSDEIDTMLALRIISPPHEPRGQRLSSGTRSSE